MKKIIIILAVLIVILILSSLIFKIGIGYVKKSEMPNDTYWKPGEYWTKSNPKPPELCKCFGLKFIKDYCLGFYYNCRSIN